MLLLWIRDDVAIVATDLNERTSQRPSSDAIYETYVITYVVTKPSLKMIFLCEYDLTWTRSLSETQSSVKSRLLVNTAPGYIGGKIEYPGCAGRGF